MKARPVIFLFLFTLIIGFIKNEALYILNDLAHQYPARLERQLM